MDQLQNIKEVAKRLNCSVKTVRRRVNKGIIPCIQEGGVGTALRFDPADIDQVMEASRRSYPEQPGDNDTAAVKKRSGRIPEWQKKINQQKRGGIIEQ